MQMICIACPNGCHLEAHTTPQGLIITGNKCIRGDGYGREEVTAPKRVVTCTVSTDSSTRPQVPVKTSAPILKQFIPELLNEIYSLTVKLPVKRGDKLISDYKGTGVDIVFTRSLS